MSENSKELQIPPEWKILLQEEFAKSYFVELEESVRKAYIAGPVFPHPSQVFRAFDLCPPAKVKVVILGQDPYHTPGVADGLAFSSFTNNPVPPSLENIYKEIEAELGITCPRTPDLTHWAEQGVLLLNTSLTVGVGEANSHVGFGWHKFTDRVVSILSRDHTQIVFMLWGNNARKKHTLIDTTKHCVLESAHPSPLSVYKGFSGNNHFVTANTYLRTHERGEISWC